MAYGIYNTWGFQIYLDVLESPMMAARSQEKYEVSKFLWMQQNLKRNETFIDVGANKGDFTLHAARYCKKVYSIEPHPDNIEWLCKSIHLNSFNNIELIQGCATNENNYVNLSIGEKSGHHSIVKQSHNTITVEGFKLDDVITEDNIVMKIDVEGAEKLVLQGAEDVIRRTKVLLIDLDSLDFEGVKNLLPDHKLLYRRGNELLFVRK